MKGVILIFVEVKRAGHLHQLIKRTVYRTELGLGRWTVRHVRAVIRQRFKKKTLRAMRHYSIVMRV